MGRVMGMEYISQVVEFFTYIVFLRYFVRVKIEKRYRYYICVLGILALPQVMAGYSFVFSQNLVKLEFVAMVFSFLLVIQDTWVRRIGYGISAYIFIGFLEILCAVAFYWVTGKYYRNYFYIIVLAFILLVQFLVQKYQAEEEGKIPAIPLTVLIVLSLVYLSGAGILMKLFVKALDESKFGKKDMIFSVFLAAVIFILNIVFMALYLQLRYEQEKVLFLQKYQKMQEEYFEMIQKGDQELRKFRHDIMGHVECIRELIDSREYGEVREYLIQMENALDRSSYPKYRCSHKVIGALVNHMGNQMEAEQIAFDFQYRVNGELTVSDFECCSLLYNLLKNAVEACRKVERTRRQVALWIENFDCNLKVTVSNSVQRNFDDRYLKSGMTSKKNKRNHGIGISNIQEVVERYQGSLCYSHEGETVIAECILFRAVKY